MMNSKETKFRFLNVTTLKIVAILLIFSTALLLLWQKKTNSFQAEGALVAQIYFEGEYRIGEGKWQKIVQGKHIPSTKGDVTLRGNFHLLTPDGEYVGLFSRDMPIAFYTDHINLIFYESGSAPYVIDHENPLFGDSMCGVGWTAHSLTPGNTEPLEIVVHNPHGFGNETAIDELLSNIDLWSGIDFEKGRLESGESQRNLGLLFLIVSILFLGSALFSSLIHVKNSKILWVLGSVILFASTYIIYSADGVSFWSDSIVSNTTILGCSMMFYMLFLAIAIVHFLKVTHKVGRIAVVFLGAADMSFLVLPMITSIFFYDTLLYWAVFQMLVSMILIGCLVTELFSAGNKERWLNAGFMLPLLGFCIDVAMAGSGVWKGGIASKYIFILLSLVCIVALLRIIPHSINALAKAKELETEKMVLHAQLTESRMKTMISQIRPHFIYNTLGSVEQLCTLDPPKARTLVHNFAKYLRGNFGELDNPKPILMSKEMEHVHHYVSIESVRFPDMTFLFEMNSGDFQIPALTIQPIVENAIKHGLMKLRTGGTIRVVSYEDDTHYCITVEDDGAGFDTSILRDERSHVGIRNIRERLEIMVNGTLEIESTVGVGTKVAIIIPKEVRT